MRYVLNDEELADRVTKSLGFDPHRLLELRVSTTEELVVVVLTEEGERVEWTRHIVKQ